MMTAVGSRRGGFAMIAVGVAMIVAGVIWWLTGGDDVADMASPDGGVATTVAAPTTSASPEGTTAPPPTAAAPPTTLSATTTLAAATTVPATTVPATTVAPTTVPPTTVRPPTVPPLESAQEFFDQFGTALADGDTDFLFERLHPEVLRRYGEDQCRAYLAGLAGASIEITVLDLSPPGPAEYERDDIVTTIDNMVVLQIERRDAGGDPVTQETRLAEFDSTVRWFTDCGDPIEGTST